MANEKSLQRLIEPVVNSFEFELWGLEYIFGKGKKKTVRLYIDSPNGINLDDCEKVSLQVSSVLEVEDLIQGTYDLEVSSPGLDRRLFTLNHYERFKGAVIKIKLNTTFDGRKAFKGLLTGVIQDEIVLLIEDDEYIFPFECISSARILPQFK